MLLSEYLFSNDQNGLGISLSWTLLQYEQGLNLRNRETVEKSLADTLATFYTQSIVPRTTAIQWNCPDDGVFAGIKVGSRIEVSPGNSAGYVDLS